MDGSRAAAAAEMIARSPMFPPSFDNSPELFAWAMFSRLLILMLSSATIVRLVSRTRAEDLPCDHPVFYHRTMISCLLMAAAFASLGDVTTWLFWGEVTPREMGMILAIGKMLDGLSMIPFLMGLFVPYWVWHLRRCGLIKGRGAFSLLTGGMTDLRVTWGQIGVPVRLTAWCAVGSLLVTAAKWAAWYAAHAA